VWSFYLKLNGARLGRGVFVNSLSMSDHNLLEFGDHVVIGSDVHLSGHTVEAGVVKTAVVRLGNRVTVGTGSVIGIGVEIGDDAQVGALSVVPKHRRLEANSTYVGVPVRRIDAPEAAEAVLGPP
jgi:acetyltransferase-like isoleucine patch superfamily enzyme